MEARVIEESALSMAAREEGEGFIVSSHADANIALAAIRAAEEKIEKLEAERDDIVENTKAFYKKKVESQENGIEYLKGQLEKYVRAAGENVSVPNGRAYHMTTTRTEWADDEALIIFGKKRGIQPRVTEKPDKTAIKKHIKEHGGGDEIYKERKGKKFIVSTNSKD